MAIMSSTFRRVSLTVFAFLTLAAATSFGAQREFCPGVSQDRRQALEEKRAHALSQFESDTTHTFFIGLWSKVKPSDNARLSKAVHSVDEDGFKSLRVEMGKLAARLAKDRGALKAWVAKNHLSAEIDVQKIPDDGTFLLAKTSRAGIEKILCAAARGDLPASLHTLSN